MSFIAIHLASHSNGDASQRRVCIAF